MQIITQYQPATLPPRRIRRQPPAHHCADFARVNATRGDRLVKWATIIVAGLTLTGIIGMAALAGSISHAAAVRQAQQMRGM